MWRRDLLFALGSALGAGALMSHRVAQAAPAPFEVLELDAPGKLASRFTLLLPRHIDSSDELRLLVALHGLGEAHDERLGVRAWLDLYGLSSSYDRLLRPPIAPAGRRGEWTPERLAEVNTSLTTRPFAGLAVACPFTPSLKGVTNRSSALAAYADWIVEQVVPRACRAASIPERASRLGLDGCSMGGPYALDTFLRHPQSFSSVGVVQPAFGLHRVPAYGERLAEVLRDHDARVQLLSSRGDPFVEPTTALAKELSRRGRPSTLKVLPGPHDQPWLREAGTVEMLLFHERGL